MDFDVLGKLLNVFGVEELGVKRHASERHASERHASERHRHRVQEHLHEQYDPSFPEMGYDPSFPGYCGEPFQVIQNQRRRPAIVTPHFKNSETSTRSLLVCNLPSNFNEDRFYRYFMIGDRVHVSIYGNTNKPWALVKFEHVLEAEQFLQRYRNHKINDKKVYVHYITLY